jgi:chorismate mutase
VSLELMQVQLARIDCELAELVRRRTALSKQLADTRRQLGGTRIVHVDEVATVRRFQGISGGQELAMILLRVGR